MTKNPTKPVSTPKTQGSPTPRLKAPKNSEPGPGVKKMLEEMIPPHVARKSSSDCPPPDAEEQQDSKRISDSSAQEEHCSQPSKHTARVKAILVALQQRSISVLETLALSLVAGLCGMIAVALLSLWIPILHEDISEKNGSQVRSYIAAELDDVTHASFAVKPEIVGWLAYGSFVIHIKDENGEYIKDENGNNVKPRHSEWSALVSTAPRGEYFATTPQDRARQLCRQLEVPIDGDADPAPVTALGKRRLQLMKDFLAERDQP